MRMRNLLFQFSIAVLSVFLFNDYYIDRSEIWEHFVPATPVDPVFLDAGSQWADSVLGTLSLEEKIAQMIMIDAYSNRNSEYTDEITMLVSKYGVGGVIFFQGGPVRQARLTNDLQSAAKIPLLVSIDAEWGLGMRLDSVISYPRQMMLGAITNEELIYQMGYDIASQMKELGIHMNLAPVADINNNPENPVINFRSFGEDRENVARKVVAYMEGMQDNGLLVTAKHFPGHGDTDTDSHFALPVINHSRERIDSIELFPFREAIRKGLSGIMVAHLKIPVLDDRENRATTLSDRVIGDLLINQLGFKGLVVTDALNMKGVSDYYEPGDLEVEAVKAGNDILLMPFDVQKTIQSVKRAVRKGLIEEERIDRSCRKILKAKYWVGLNEWEPVDLEGLTDRINKRDYSLLVRQLTEQAHTVLVNKDNLIPLKGLENIRLATVSSGMDIPNTFTLTTDLYIESDHFILSPTADLPSRVELQQKLAGYNVVIINLFGLSPYASKRFGLTDQQVHFVENLNASTRVILNVAGYPYALKRFTDLSGLDAIMISNGEDDLNQSVAAQVVFGGLPCLGRIPVSVNGNYFPGDGADTDGNIRLSYTVPEAAGLSYDTLLRIDSIITDAIRNKAIPGCQVLVARFGKVIWHRAYGYHTYLERTPVELNHLYDLASVTKIASVIPSLMLLRDRGKFSEDSLLKVYLPAADTSPLGDLLIKEILTHQAGLVPWIPFYYSTIEPLDKMEKLLGTKQTNTFAYQLGNHTYMNRNVRFRDSIFSTEYSALYPVQVANRLFMRADYIDTIYQTIYNAELKSKEYRYSDLGYYLLQQAIESITDTLLYPFVFYNLYAPLGATTLGYLPLNRFKPNRIVPTENDMYFRRQLIWGYVHDPGAAMLGGICGHAGLFSSANDLAKMMQIYLNDGWYGGDHYLDSATIRTYTQCVFCDNGNRRGLGFDRPVTDETNDSPASKSASETSFGHSGFTGTIVWMDPEYGILYIFLSNRIHPNQSNMKLIEMNVRTDVQQVIYDAIEN